MDKFIKTATGGLPVRLDDLMWTNGELDAANYGTYEAIQALLLPFGSNFIVEGCVYSAPNLTAGWIMLDGELMRVDAQAGSDDYFAKVSTFDSRGDKVFKDASAVQTYQKNRGVLNAASGTLNITTALRLPDVIVQDIAANSTEEFAVANIPNLPTSKITSGTFAAARIPQATETAVGGAEIATSAEVQTGTNNTRIVTPSGLSARTATEARTGVLELATQTETNTGTDDARAVTPLKLATTTFDAGKITSGTFAAARIPQATETAVGGAEIATSTEVNTGTDNTRIVTPAGLSARMGGMLTKVVDIGDWDMVASANVLVNHGLTYSSIVGIRVLIRSDTDSNRRQLGSVTSGAGILQGAQASSTQITLARDAGGDFDNTNYDSTSYNRGWIILDYLQ